MIVLRVVVGEPKTDAERIQQLEAQALLLIERRRDVALEIRETGRRQRSPPTGLPASCAARGAPTPRRLRAWSRAALRACSATKRLTCSRSSARSSTSILLITIDDLLAPVADVFEERPLAFGERTIRGRHEQHQVGLRHELVGEPLVLAEDRVGAGVSTMSRSRRSGTGAVMTSTDSCSMCRPACRRTAESAAVWWSASALPRARARRPAR